MIPATLTPTTTELIDGVDVATARPLFSPWQGVMPTDTYNRKPVLHFAGEMVFAELAILRLFQQDGWEGCWVDSYRNRFLTGYWPTPQTVALPRAKQQLLNLIRERAGRSGGCFDVICWKADAIMFAESKAPRDKIRPSQINWFRAARAVGVPLDRFLIVKWDFAMSGA